MKHRHIFEIDSTMKTLTFLIALAAISQETWGHGQYELTYQKHLLEKAFYYLIIFDFQVGS